MLACQKHTVSNNNSHVLDCALEVVKMWRDGEGHMVGEIWWEVQLKVQNSGGGDSMVTM